MKNYTFFFDKVNPSFLGSTGGKGLRLAQLYKQGFPIPNGFCVSADAYKEFIKVNKIEGYINNRLYLLESCKDSISKISKNIRQKIITAQIPDELSQSILTAYRELQKKGGNQVAVRSSAIAEDTAEASFAGQHDSFLCIEEDIALLQSIKKCWASLWTERVIDYRIQKKFIQNESAIAVIVQQMVPAEISGVLFTVNPVSGDTDEMVINAAWGLGEALVSGKVEADNIIVSKCGRIKVYQIGRDNKSKIKHSRGNAYAQKKCVNDHQIKELVKLGRKLEGIFRAPQDIEWAISSGRIYLLQARPITTLEDGEEEHWTADNAQEACPTVVCPLTAEFMENFLNNTFQNIASLFGFTEKLQFGKAIGGYFYLSKNNLKKLFSKIVPGVDDEMLAKQLMSGGSQGGLKIKPNLKMIRLLPAGIKSVYYITRLPAKYLKLVETFNKELNRYPETYINNATAKQLLEARKNSVLEVNANEIMFYALYGGLAYVAFYSYLCTIIDNLPEELGIAPSFFFTGLDLLEDARAKRDFQKLASDAKKEPAVYNLIFQEEPAEISTKIEYIDNDSVFKKNFTNFLNKYGHLSDNILELMCPRWAEDQSSLWKIMKAIFKTNGDRQTGQKPLSRKKAKEIVEKYFSKQSKFLPVKKWQFKIALKYAVKYVQYRENFRFHIVKVLSVVRRLILREGQILKEAGYIENTDDVFFLINEEIEAALNSLADKKKIAAMIKKRRTDYEKWSNKKPPSDIFIRKNIVRREYIKVDEKAAILKGIPVSGGAITGKARVLNNISEAEKLQKGEILVTKFTDPAWTPLFNLANGIVVDIGSMLSHGAIIAREIGIPAVLGVRYGTEVIKDGQEITVDGTKGIVIISKPGDVRLCENSKNQ